MVRRGLTCGRYHFVRTVGNGSFAKVKLAVHAETGEKVAVKIIDKKRVAEAKLMEQVKREISTMKLLRHPNIVRIHEVIATKTTIFLIMEFVPGGNLAEKLSYRERLNEEEARKYFQQLIDVVDYCHGRGVYHRDLKPQNLLIDSKGNLKVSDFGLSIFMENGQRTMLSTTCGSPHYVAPEVIVHKSYEGAGADVWSCGVILFELLAGKVPFDDINISNLYRKIARAQYEFPKWFTKDQKQLICKMLDPVPVKRITVPEILKDEWFRVDYKSSLYLQTMLPVNDGKEIIDKSSKNSSFINAFQLIAMSDDLDLSSLFEENYQKKIKMASDHSMTMTLEKIEAAAKDASLSVERTRDTIVTLHGIKELRRSRSHVILSAEVTPVTPQNCVVELSKSAGELTLYKEFCRSLSYVLKECSSGSFSESQFSESDSYFGDDESTKGDAESSQQNSFDDVCGFF